LKNEKLLQETQEIANCNDVRDTLLQAGFALTTPQCGQLEKFVALLAEWNERINLISRKNMHGMWRDHILHSLAPAAILNLPSNASYLDLGTGGGLPGIPMAIVFPESSFVLLDSIGKKINAVSAIAEALSLSNVRCQCARAEELAKDAAFTRRFDVVLARAVTELPSLVKWSKPFLKRHKASQLVVWKGGDISDEVRAAARFAGEITVHDFSIGNFGYFVSEDKKLLQVHFHHDNQ
jgi:16S rRNA (guanine527-N7)-methyltransferase